MSWYTDMLTEKATYWKVQNDGYGGIEIVEGPVVISCRWEEKNELARDEEGNEFVTDSIVFVDVDLEGGWYLYQGESSANTASEVQNIAYEIRKFQKIPSVDGDEYERKTLL